MALDDALALLVGELPELLPRLADADRAALLRMLSALDPAAGDEDREDAFADLLTDLLPTDHPVLAAFRWRSTRRGTETLDREAEAALMARLRAIVDDAAGTYGIHLDGGAEPTALERIKQRLLATPTLSAAEVDADTPGLLRLRTPGGELRFPSFQFDEERRPRPVVLAVNDLLYGDEDPWGVTSWWLTGNVWLDDTPAQLLGRVPDDTLVSAATIVRERD